MIIVAGGDSVTFGSELKDCANGHPNAYSRSTYPALLAGDAEYHCVAYPGIGNKEICDRVIDKVNEIGRCGVIVTWTWPYRTKEINADEHILKLHDFLVGKNCPYLFHALDYWVVRHTEDKSINWDNWFWFPEGTLPGGVETLTPRGFYQWAVESKYSVGPDMHPLEDAHQAAYERMKDKFNELVTQHLQ